MKQKIKIKKILQVPGIFLRGQVTHRTDMYAGPVIKTKKQSKFNSDFWCWLLVKPNNAVRFYSPHR